MGILGCGVRRDKLGPKRYLPSHRHSLPSNPVGGGDALFCKKPPDG